MRSAVGAVGRALVTVGLLILAFVAYQLWGTGLYEAREQSRLKHDFNAAVARQATTTTAPTPATPPVTAAPPPPTGDAVAVIRIPKIGVQDAVVQGVGVPDLRKGPGHYPLTPLPGELGNAAIAGHRTTYGAPFNRLDELGNGDQIDFTTLHGVYHYRVTDKKVVQPTELSVLDPTTTATLTLTTCNPKYSAAQRLVVKAGLDAAVSPPPLAPRPIPVSKLTGAGLSGSKESHLPAIWWGIAAFAAGLGWWFAFHRYRRWTTWLIGFVPFVVVLFFFYVHFERLLPGNF